MKRGFAVLVVLLGLGCGDSARHPDTGAGAGEIPPATPNCADLCTRLGDCVVILCDEDTNSTRYEGLGQPLTDSCLAGCTDAQLQTAFPAAGTWQCLFQDSCRQVFDYDSCHGMGHYNCN